MKHAGVFRDFHRFAVVFGHAAENARREPAELAGGGVDHLHLIGRRAGRFDHRWRGVGRRGPHHGVDYRLGVFDQVERPPGGLDMLPGHLQQMGCQKEAKPLKQAGKRFARCLGNRREQ